MNTYYLALQSTPSQVEIGLFCNGQMISFITEDKMNASREILSLLDHILQKSHVLLSECSFIAVNKGPGFFTTLRTVIAYANGLSFSTSIPIIGIDCLQASIKEFANSAFPHTVFLLDACAQEVYYIYFNPVTKQLEEGYKNIKALLEDITRLFPDTTVRFIGQGATVYASFITSMLDKCAYIPEANPAQCSLSQIAALALEEWQISHTGTQQLLPHYIKRHPLDTSN